MISAPEEHVRRALGMPEPPVAPNVDVAHTLALTVSNGGGFDSRAMQGVRRA